MPTAWAAAEIDVDELIDIDAYPIHELSSPARAELVATTRAEMQDSGCFRIPAFLRPATVERMRTEAIALHGLTFWSKLDHNPYFTDDDATWPIGHPRRTFQRRRSGFINSDLLTSESALRKLYDCDVLLHFVWECLGTARPIYRWADPLGRNPYAVMEPGHVLPWHFDGNEFTVSLLAQRADAGGVFEYVPNIRRPDAENFEHVAHILAGGRDGVRQLDLVPGDLQLFAGRYSLHRVTEIEGSTTRYIGLPTYVHDPYRMNRPYHSLTVYGRYTPLHAEREHLLVDGLVD